MEVHLTPIKTRRSNHVVRGRKVSSVEALEMAVSQSHFGDLPGEKEGDTFTTKWYCESIGARINVLLFKEIHIYTMGAPLPISAAINRKLLKSELIEPLGKDIRYYFPSENADSVICRCTLEMTFWKRLMFLLFGVVFISFYLARGSEFPAVSVEVPSDKDREGEWVPFSQSM